MGILQKIGFMIGLIAFLWFFLPFVVAGIWNIGNITGMAVSILWMFFMKCMPLVHKWTMQLAETNAGKGVLIVISMVFISIAVLVVAESVSMIHAATKEPEENATAVVLGCRVYGERPSLSLVERLEAAYDYLTEYPEAVCVVSGGQGEGEDISEAEAMYRWLTDKGIDGARVYKEEQSTNTDENICFSKEVIKENGLNEQIAIVTSEYHTYRASLLAEKYGLPYGAAPGKTAMWLFPTFYVRELYAVLAEWVLE